MSPRHRYESAPSKSSNKNVTAAREKNKNLINFTNIKSHDPSFKRASNFENDDMGPLHPFSQTKENLNNEALTTCAVCRRTFKSVKAMHGHLRKHPNRGYKGAVPPPNIAKKLLVQLSSTSAPQMDISGSKRPVTANSEDISVSKRPVTANSDFTSIPKRDPNRLIDPTNETSKMTFMLVYLSIKSSKQGSCSSGDKEIYKSSKTKRKNMVDDFRVIKDKEEMGYEGGYHSIDHQIEEDNSKEYIEESRLQPLSSLIKKKTKKLARFHPCGICDKFFSTHQALGGHMTSHNKNKNNMNEAFTANEVELSHVEKPTIKMTSKGSDSGVHKCKICGKIFTSGQALGGHKRKHYIEEQIRKEMNVALDHDRKESNVTPDLGTKESLPNHSQKESNGAFDHGRKESSIAPDHDQKKSNDVLDDHWKENNAAPNYDRKESNVMRDIDLNKSVGFDQDLPS